MKKSTLVIGVIGADCHAVGNKVLDRVFTAHDFRVINLGVMVSQDEYIDAAIETGADAIVVSSIYGHGDIDCLGLRERCIERGIGDILLYVGGNLVVFTSSSGDESSAAYKEMKHGLFTYYLLKKLQITKGSCTYAELDEYLRKEVSVTSLVVNKRQQTPQVVGGPEVGDRWKEWKIK